MSNQIKHNFGWGDTRGIREIMMQHASFLYVMNHPWQAYGYPAHEGAPELIEELKKLIFSLTNTNYKYILVTNGATSALNAYITSKKGSVIQNLLTHKLHFSFYPGIAATHGLDHIKEDNIVYVGPETISIIDSPTNPAGKMIGSGPKNVIWDAAYYSPTYCGIANGSDLISNPIRPPHEAIAGSLNKLTGINGLRVGYLATDSLEIYNKALDFITYDLCGVSAVSQHITTEILKKVDLNQFYKDSKKLIDDNKNELLRLNKIFSNQEIPRHGMFALFEVDNKILRLLEKASVEFMPGYKIGDDRNSVRINLSNSNKSTKLMVEDILKVDSRR